MIRKLQKFQELPRVPEIRQKLFKRNNEKGKKKAQESQGWQTSENTIEKIYFLRWWGNSEVQTRNSLLQVVQTSGAGVSKAGGRSPVGRFGSKKQRRQGHNKHHIAKSYLQETLNHGNRIKAVLNNEDS